MLNKLILAAMMAVPAINYASYVEINPVTNYGWLDQYSLNTEHHFIGDEACVPTSSTNGLTYLQNAAPAVFGSTLSGTTYADWHATADVLIQMMGTTVGNGTSYDQFVYALSNYIENIKDYPQVQFSGMFPSDTWSNPYTAPNYIVTGVPTIAALTNAIAAGSAVLTSIEYSNGGGHEILINGIEWDPATQTGTVYFIDPLDPSENYSPDIPLGPVKQTSGTLELSSDGTKLILHYSQYAGGLPYDGSYDDTSASLFGFLSVGGAPFVPFSELLESGNTHKIALGFDKLDPTTAEMFPVMAVLNTSSNLHSAFSQMDPSVFDPIAYSAESVVKQVRIAVSDNLLLYRKFCGCQPKGCSVRAWATSLCYDTGQKGAHGHSGYKTRNEGFVSGLDAPISRNMIAGAAFAYAKSDIKWHSAPAKAELQNYEGILYTGWEDDPYWVEASFSYTNDHVHAQRNLFLTSAIPFIDPVSATLTHKTNYQTYAGHIGGNCEIGSLGCGGCNIILWPFINVDYIFTHRPAFKESGSAIFAQHVAEKHTALLSSEFGLGSTMCVPLYRNYSSYWHFSGSYVSETRFSGGHTHSYFESTPDSTFTVAGLYPQNNFFRTGVIFGIKGAQDAFRLHVAYHCDLSDRYVSNDVSVEVSLAF